jgi:hypothetical protein
VLMVSSALLAPLRSPSIGSTLALQVATARTLLLLPVPLASGNHFMAPVLKASARLLLPATTVGKLARALTSDSSALRASTVKLGPSLQGRTLVQLASSDRSKKALN